jgi:uncharacterized protein (DUF934 family)
MSSNTITDSAAQSTLLRLSGNELQLFVDAPAALVVQPEDDVEQLADAIALHTVVAINFPKFTDGRGFSSAYLLRTRLGFKGDIRAVGEVLVDQLQSMKRCGFTSFELSAVEGKPQSIASAQKAINGFHESYQAFATQAQPLFRRRNALSNLQATA